MQTLKPKNLLGMYHIIYIALFIGMYHIIYIMFTWNVSYYLYYDYAVSRTTLSDQLQIYATNNKPYCKTCSFKHLVKIKYKSFSVLACYRLY